MLKLSGVNLTWVFWNERDGSPTSCGTGAVHQSVDTDEQVQDFHNISWTICNQSKISDTRWVTGDAVREYTASQLTRWSCGLQLPLQSQDTRSSGWCYCWLQFSVVARVGVRKSSELHIYVNNNFSAPTSQKPVRSIKPAVSQQRDSFFVLFLIWKMRIFCSYFNLIW